MKRVPRDVYREVVKLVLRKKVREVATKLSQRKDRFLKHS